MLKSPGEPEKYSHLCSTPQNFDVIHVRCTLDITIKKKITVQPRLKATGQFYDLFELVFITYNAILCYPFAILSPKKFFPSFFFFFGLRLLEKFHNRFFGITADILL